MPSSSSRLSQNAACDFPDRSKLAVTFTQNARSRRTCFGLLTRRACPGSARRARGGALNGYVGAALQGLVLYEPSATASLYTAALAVSFGAANVLGIWVDQGQRGSKQHR